VRFRSRQQQKDEIITKENSSTLTKYYEKLMKSLLHSWWSGHGDKKRS